MKYKELLLRSKDYLKKNPEFSENRFSLRIFSWGAKWMFDRLNDLESKKDNSFDYAVNFMAYGAFKYTLCLTAFLMSAIFFSKISLFLLPFSIFIFYLFEVHFLFLFPLLIDKVKRPMLTSIKQTYRIGVFKAIFTVMPIGFFMLIGLINRKALFFKLAYWMPVSFILV